MATVITYIKPTHNLDVFSICLENAQKSKHLDKFLISFKEKLSVDFIDELNKYDNIVWKDDVDNFWASEMRDLISENPSDYYYIWEEDSHIFDIISFALNIPATVTGYAPLTNESAEVFLQCSAYLAPQ